MRFNDAGSMRLTSLLQLAVILLLVLTGNGCQPDDVRPEPFTIVWTYDVSGELHPCGCSAHMLGGLARRYTKIDELRSTKPVITIEGGYIFENSDRFQLFKGTIIAKALNAMSYDGMMLGVREAQQGISGIEEIQAIAEFPLFSANLKVDDQPWVTSTIMVDTGSTKVGITGVTQLEMVTFSLPESVGFAPPEQGLEVALGNLTDKVDMIVVCLEGDTAWVKAMSEKYASQADLFLSGDRSMDAHKLALAQAEESEDSTNEIFVLPNLEFSADPPRMNNWGLGRFLGVLNIVPGSNLSITGTNTPLDETIPEALVIKQILDDDYKPQLQQFFAEYSDEVVQDHIPPERCGECHIAEYAVYEASAHAQSAASLQEIGQIFDPDCIICHVVYDKETEELHAINCLTCHSNIDWNHEWQAIEGMVAKPSQPVVEYEFAWCVKCHDEENSLPFAKHWPQYVSLIYHGGNTEGAEIAAEKLGIDMTKPPPDLTDTSMALD